MADRRLMVQCSCTCSILVFEAWDVGKPEAEWFAEVFKRPGKAHWRWRLRKAVGLVLGNEPVVDDLCFGPRQIIEIRDFLNECYPLHPSPPRAFHEYLTEDDIAVMNEDRDD